jgi:dUTP pyrophosphatase
LRIVKPVVKIQRIRKSDAPLPLPAYHSVRAAGMDLRADIDQPMVLRPRERAAVPTGIAVQIPPGFEGQVRPRSGRAISEGLTLINAPGTIDADYRGEVKVLLVNLGEAEVSIRSGERIAQLVIAPVVRAEVEEVDQLEESSRGDGGFGHTGR